MKYICLGYYDRSKHEAMTEAEKQAMFDWSKCERISTKSKDYGGKQRPEIKYASLY